jgi:hypothetical protein
LKQDDGKHSFIHLSLLFQETGRNNRATGKVEILIVEGQFYYIEESLIKVESN